MKKWSVIFFVILMVIAAACAPARTLSSEAPMYDFAPPAAAAPMEPEKAMAEAYDMTREESASGRAGVDSAAVERVVIKNADLSLVVPDPAEAMATISSMAEGMGGFVVNSNLYKRTTSNGVEVPEASITVRVPAEQLNQAMDQIKALVNDPVEDILTENVNGQDVTREYTDLKSRLRNLENARDKLESILEDANRTEDVLAVYNQLTYVTEQIEVLQGQIKYYDEAASLSALSVRLQSEESVQPIKVGGWQPVGVARDAVQMLVRTMQGLGSMAIWLVLYFLPTAIVFLVPLYLFFLLVRAIVRRRKGKLPPAPVATD